MARGAVLAAEPGPSGWRKADIAAITVYTVDCGGDAHTPTPCLGGLIVEEEEAEADLMEGLLFCETGWPRGHRP